MSLTKRQKVNLHWASICQGIAGKKKRSTGAERLMAEVRRTEKRKRAQFRRGAP